MGALQQRHDLLDAWLAALNRLDNPLRRRAAKCRPTPPIFTRSNLRPVEYPLRRIV
jgi:hypothetical protein